MDIMMINKCLATGEIERPSLFPHVDRLNDMPYVFAVDFGLSELPTEPGILLIRGARQYGKSTWLEQQIIKSIEQFGAGSAFYLNGENILKPDKLEAEIETLLAVFSKDAAVRRIFIDEITAIDGWEIALKKMADRGKLRHILIITTGSKATDLRQATERLPGRKGKLARTNYLFTPISYSEFKQVCGKKLGEKTLLNYLISGGSPIACAELASDGVLPEYVIELVRDWIDGEIARSGRSRSSLFNIMSVLFKLGGSPIGQAKLARESGLANNTVAQGYIDILQDLGCVVPAYPWDQHKDILIKRKECKYHFSNLLASVAYHPSRIRSIDDFLALPETEQGIWHEWLVAQEIVRRKTIHGTYLLEPLAFWQNKQHEIDYFISKRKLVEVKRGKVSALDFAWFPKQFPKKHLIVINKNPFSTNTMSGYSLENFLLDEKLLD